LGEIYIEGGGNLLFFFFFQLGFLEADFMTDTFGWNGICNF
jgi:hypothetical protein